MPVVVVESPAKAKTINKYLGNDYTVLASFGHVRDLPPKDGSVDPDEDFAMKWEIASDSKKHIKAIVDALKNDNALILADKFSIENETQAEMAVQAINSRDLVVKSVEAKPGSRNPSPPFMTSTLQQEASRKFGMGAKQTMSVAQRLYEAGLITYMRTDGIDMAPEAVSGARDAIKAKFGEKYLPLNARPSILPATTVRLFCAPMGR